jgi:hypothetical protein
MRRHHSTVDARAEEASDGDLGRIPLGKSGERLVVLSRQRPDLDCGLGVRHLGLLSAGRRLNEFIVPRVRYQCNMNLFSD